MKIMKMLQKSKCKSVSEPFSGAVERIGKDCKILPLCQIACRAFKMYIVQTSFGNVSAGNDAMMPFSRVDDHADQKGYFMYLLSRWFS